MKKQEGFLSGLVKKPLKTAAWSGILIFAAFLIYQIVSYIVSMAAPGSSSLNFLLSVYTIASLIITSLFTYGFYILGIKYNRGFLKICSLLLIIFFIVSSILSIFFLNPLIMGLVADLESLTSSTAESQGIDTATMTNEQSETLNTALLGAIQANPEMIKQTFILLGYLGVLLLIFLVLTVLFYSGMIGLGKQVRYAKLAGIFGIVGLFTAIIFVGLFLLIAAYIFKIIILFSESKKFE